MRKIKKGFIKALCCLLVIQAGGMVMAASKKSSSKKKAMPEWVTQPSAVYPNPSYITYVGNGADRNISEINALQGLASVFGQSIKSDSTASSRLTQAKENGLVANTNTQVFSQEVKRKVDVDSLIGVEVKEFWFDDKDTWYAIAVLDKSKATELYSDMIKKNAAAIETVIKNGEKDLYSFDGFGAYDFAEDIALENENHLKKLAVINPPVVDDLKSFCPSSKKLHAKKMEIAKQIPICIQTSNDENGRYKDAFSQAVAEAGFKATADTSARYQLLAKFDFERSDTSDKKTVRCRYNAESYILDNKTSHQLVPFSIKGREAHVDYDEAKHKAETSLTNKIKKDFSKAFYDYIRSSVTE
ncbi:hypothetical protein MSI_00080 [Treponema sp. JC4]|uniref:LPP20 family lipoprotein n=1 Tax=Treponema sp. JC4 TaxID=1124982 RepID=UPI00025B0D36|nr:LPP20 family lipoprotein [Treponema sp. JC4]EID86052.1 hypothetical protein MSI_00080 [Treponema sp. JC4]